MPLVPLICRSRYENVKKVIKIGVNLENQKKSYTFVMSKKTRVLTVSYGTLKNRIIMKKKLFIAEFRDEISKRNWFIVRETTISKVFKEAGKICEINNVKFIGIIEA